MVEEEVKVMDEVQDVVMAQSRACRSRLVDGPRLHPTSIHKITSSPCPRTSLFSFFSRFHRIPRIEIRVHQGLQNVVSRSVPHIGRNIPFFYIKKRSSSHRPSTINASHVLRQWAPSQRLPCILPVSPISDSSSLLPLSYKNPLVIYLDFLAYRHFLSSLRFNSSRSSSSLHLPCIEHRY
ncbi:hypothetical protein BDZ45DRAFT_12858 [Acephala macrosclerotiorum]|nr:hypothetical protein BDZ45DRAFT_12858 [Acephala macrosclerotiorum]